MVDVVEQGVDGLVGDGRPLLSVTGLALWLSGAFALFLSARREFLPHDVTFLGQTAAELCAVADCRVNRFMFHDRVAFGGTLLAIALVVGLFKRAERKRALARIKEEQAAAQAKAAEAAKT